MKKVLSDYCIAIFDCEHKTAPLSDTGYPSIRTPNIGKGRLILDGVNLVSEETWKAFTKRAIPQVNDLILAREAPAGNVALIPENLKLCLGQRTVLIRPNQKKIVPKFLCYYILSPKIQHELLSKSSGSTVAHINVKDIKNLNLFEIPQIDIQHKIASILSAYDDLIENNLKRIKLLEELAQRTYEEWFVKFRVKGEALEMDELMGLPVGWREGTFADLINFQNGFAFKSSKFVSSGQPVIKIKNIDNNKVDVLNCDCVDKEYAKLAAKFKLDQGDLLIAMTGATVGKVGFMPYSEKDCYLNQRVGRFVNKDEKNNIPFVFCVMTQGQGLKQVLNFASGAAQPNISGVQILAISTIIPNNDILRRFNDYAQSIISQILLIQNQNRLLKEARDILLPRLMNGTISLKVAETKPATKIIQLDASTQKQTTPQFKEAILISLLTSKFGSEKYPLGRMRYTKLSYLFHRHADNQIKDYLRKAAGPYNPKTKYGGAEKIAHDNGYVTDCKNGHLTGFVAGPNIQEARSYFERYWNIEYLTWLEEQFKYKSNDDLELFATVDNSLIELKGKNESFTVEAVKNILKKEPEWTAKLEREIFNDANIQRAITYLPTIFQY